MRKPHIIREVGDRPRPDIVLCVQVKCEQLYEGESDDVGHLEMVQWTAKYGVPVGNTIKWLDCQGGTTQIQFFGMLDRTCSGVSNAWLMSWQAREVVAAIGLWDQLERGDYVTEGSDPYAATDANGGKPGDSPGYLVLDGPPTIITFRHAERPGRYTWLDPQNYGVRSMCDYNHDILRVGANDPELSGESWINNAPPVRWCNAVAEWLETYFRAVIDLDLGGPEHTAATQAMQGFRHAYMGHAIHIHDSATALEFERHALYGGRCECRYVGYLHSGAKPGILPGHAVDAAAVRYDVGPITHFDVNSLYPAVAKDAMLPVRLAGMSKHVGHNTLIAACKNCCVVAWCHVTTSVPVAPLRHEGLTVFPIGTFQTVLCGPEILLVLKSGGNVRALYMAVYEGRPIYTKWVRQLHAARLNYDVQGRHGMADVCKRILNASFGKWAQRSKKWVDYPEHIPPGPYMQWLQRCGETDELESWRSIAWNVQRLCPQGESNESFPAITAYINSLGRVRLWELIEAAGQTNVYYYDTDSLIVNDAGRERLLSSGQVEGKTLGRLKVVGSYSNLRIMGRQAYMADGKLTLSGANSPAIAIDASHALALKAAPLQHYLVKGEQPGLDRHTARVRTTRRYLHGHVLPDGSVRPILMDDGQKMS